MFKQSLPSIEQFAAYLDGNLSRGEMLRFSQMAEQNSELHQLLDASKEVDSTIAGFTDVDLQLPPEIADTNFELPMISTDGISSFVTLTPEPIEDMFVAACAYEDTMMIHETSQEEHLIAEDSIHDNPTLSMSNDDSLDNNVDDLPSSLSEL